MIAPAIKASRRFDPYTGAPVQSTPASAHSSVALRREVQARYDNAQTTDDNRRHWAAADSLDADSANSLSVRRTLVKRSRYETANNGFLDGIVQTFATDLVGIGPTLRMETRSEAFNRAVEYAWGKWAKAVFLRRKLWCMANAKPQDGEAFAVLRNNPKLRDKVKLDVVLFETEQCQSPQLPWLVPGRIDGVYFDEFGNPEFYDVLKYHPGAGYAIPTLATPEKVPADKIVHWFQLRRPGQHRGVPEFRSTLGVGAASRRFREAVLGASEIAASFAVLLEQTHDMGDDADTVSPMSTMEIEKKMMTALPDGTKPYQMEAKHPNATYETFVKSQINELARPKSMPFNKAACDSSSYNYASGRLDHQTYYGALNVEREDGNDLVLDPLFREWWKEAVDAWGWNGTPDEVPDHAWDWPKHPVADIVSEANANNIGLRNGSLSLSHLYSQQGEDFEDHVATMANDYGVTVDEMRRMLLNANLNAQNQQASQTQEIGRAHV